LEAQCLAVDRKQNFLLLLTFEGGAIRSKPITMKLWRQKMLRDEEKTRPYVALLSAKRERVLATFEPIETIEDLLIKCGFFDAIIPAETEDERLAS
jgi:hypothetical protein